MAIETIKLNIEGMTCNGCSSHIEKDINKIDGITNSIVNHENNNGEFTFNKDKLSKNDVIEAVNAIGNYKVINEKEDCCSTSNSNDFENKEHNNNFDLIIIGGGSAAFSAAIKAESLGLSTLMVNGGLDFGGTCVNVGCVPSKNLIRAAETVYHANHSNFGSIKPLGAEIDFKQLIKDKKELVSALQQ